MFLRADLARSALASLRSFLASAVSRLAALDLAGCGASPPARVSADRSEVAVSRTSAGRSLTPAAAADTSELVTHAQSARQASGLGGKGVCAEVLGRIGSMNHGPRIFYIN